MNTHTIKQANQLAKSFAKQADYVLRNCLYEIHDRTILERGKHTAALRRLSMDLTRALAELRKVH